MEVKEIFQTIGELLEATATVKLIYGDPVTAGDRTVIPVARVRFGFGAGGMKIGGGAGGGGGVRADPMGVIEITAAGTFFKALPDNRRRVAALAVGIGIGMALARLKR